MNARALVQTGIRQVEFRSYSIPEIGPEEGILRVEQSGVCGSDWSQYTHGLPMPHVPGHEPVGVIHEIGEIAAARWKVQKGDRVALETMLPCGYCRSCVTGHYNLCRPPGTRVINAYGYMDVAKAPSLWGGHAEYMYLDPHSLVHRMDSSLSPAIASMFNPLGAGVRWAQRMPGTGIGDTVVILGCGQRGLTSVIAAREAGARRVIVTGLTADALKMEVARAFGADVTIDVEKQSTVSAVREATGGDMADVVVDVTSGATQPVADALDLARPGGRIVLAGGKYGPVPEFDSRKIMAKELTIMGALAVDYESYEAAIRIIESRKYPLELMHTHTLPLADAERALLILGNEVAGEHGIHLSIEPHG